MTVVDWIKLLEGVTRSNRRVNKVWNLIQLSKEYPALADHSVLLNQPKWWLESIMNLLDAQGQYREAHKNE